MKVDFKQIASTAGKMANRHLPMILVGVGLAGMVKAGIDAVGNTKDALDAIEDARREKARITPEVEFTKTDAVKAAWTFYAGPVLLAVLSSGCVIASTRISYKREAALAGLLKLSQENYQEFRKQAEKIVGTKKVEEIEGEVDKKRLATNPPPEGNLIQGMGSTLCYDVISGRYFMSDVDRIRRIETALNRRLYDDMFITLNEFYDELYIDHCDAGEMLRWNVSDGPIGFYFDTRLTEDERPCVVLKYAGSLSVDYPSYCSTRIPR